MHIGLREFLRKFQRAKLRALAGETVTIQGRDELFIFKKSSAAVNLLGCCKDIGPKKKINLLKPLEDPSIWEND
jgi:hypothetical protein